jgi:hypothetical protein
MWLLQQNIPKGECKRGRKEANKRRRRRRG